ncbi:MAG: SUMF1/EgtB/PvdO family nonheme iron enzyme [Bacteroidota bacterium]
MNKDEKINDLFRQAREQETQASFNETKKLFLKSLESQKADFNDNRKGKVFTFKNSIIMSTIVGLTALIISLFYVQNQEVTFSDIKKEKIENSNQKTSLNQNQIKKTKEKVEGKVSRNEKKVIENQNSSVFLKPIIDSYDELLVSENNSINGSFQNYFYGQKVNEEYIFPKLTEEEIEKTKKQKKRMLKALAKMDRDYYSYIPSGSFEYLREMISVQGFFMQKTEVSNLEYRTYLFDLLINGKKEEFLKAKPDQQAWKIALRDSAQYMIDNYFSNVRFDNYPVNNISREGAELYCKWLTQELIVYVGEKDAVKYNDMRIPTRQEWVKAASNEGKQLPYAFSDSNLYDKKLNYFKANFNLKNFNYPKMVKDENYKKNQDFYPAVKFFSNNKSKTPYTWDYKVICNDLKLYNLSGNVAEMVVVVANNLVKVDDGMTSQKPNSQHGTAGGGWMNSAEGIKINAPDNHPNVTEAHPNIGFRVVMTHVGKGHQKMTGDVKYELR